MRELFLSLFWLLLAMSIALFSLADTPAMAQAGPPREHTVRLVYDTANIYAGRMANAKAATRKLQEFLDAHEFTDHKPISFLKHVLKSSMLPAQGYVMTLYGFGYGACGAPSLLNQMVRTAMFTDSDGTQKPVFEATVWRRENSPTYGKYGVAIFLDPSGEKSSDYAWRLNPDYQGAPPQITIEIEDFGKETGQITMRMVYSDELPVAAGPTVYSLTSKLYTPTWARSASTAKR